MDSSHRKFIISAAAIGSAAAIPAFSTGDTQTEVRPKTREISNLQNVHLDGGLGASYETATCNVLARQDRYSLTSFRFSASGVVGALWWDWRDDQIGRYLSMLHEASRSGWTPAEAKRLYSYLLRPIERNRHERPRHSIGKPSKSQPR
jgi:hypothetical protein